MKSTTPLLLILISIIGAYYFVLPKYKDISVIKEEANKYEEAILKVSEIEDTKLNLLKSYNSFSEEEKNKINEFLPDSSNSVKLLADIENMALRYGIQIKSAVILEGDTDSSEQINESARGKPYESTVINFNFDSTYKDMVEFLTDIENSLRLMDVRSVSFGSSQSSIYTYTVSVETYWLK